jgi:hypothetical protein
MTAATFRYRQDESNPFQDAFTQGASMSQLQAMSETMDETEGWFEQAHAYHGGNVMIVQGDAAEEIIDIQLSNIRTQLDEMSQHVGSGWVFLWARKTFLNVYTYNPLHGAGHMQLPDWVSPRACINPQNSLERFTSYISVPIYEFTNLCFAYAVIIALDYRDGLRDQQRITTTVDARLNHFRAHPRFNMYDFPMPLVRKTINKYEEVFGANIWVWKACNETRKPIPLAPSPCKYERDILLLFIESPSGEEGHYVWVKNPSKLVARHTSAGHHASYPCLSCGMPYTTEAALQEHRRLCIRREAALPKMPVACGKKRKNESEEDYAARVEKAGRDRLKFSQHHATLDVPAYMVFDFEASTLRPTGGDPKVYAYQNINSGQLVVYDKIEGRVIASKTFFGEDSVRQLMDEVQIQARFIYDKYFTNPKPLVVDRSTLCHETECCICGDKLRKKACTCSSKETGICVCAAKTCFCKAKSDSLAEDDHHNDLCACVHHCHYSGKVFGLAHKSCNLKARVVPRIPVFAHNFKGYDQHPILKAMRGSDYDKILMIADNSAKYKHMKWTKLDHDARDRLAEELDEEALAYEFAGDKEVVRNIHTKEVVEDADLFYKVVHNRRILGKIKTLKYDIEWKDSLLFLQSGLERVAESLADKDFACVREYIQTLPSTKNLRELLLERGPRTREECDDPKRGAFLDMVAKFMLSEDTRYKKYTKPSTIQHFKDLAVQAKRDAWFAFLENPNPEEFTFRVCRRKGIYPYDWVRSWDVFDAPSLPPMEPFKSKLQEVVGFSAAKLEQEKLAIDYSFAQLVWSLFGFKTFREYHDMYLALDCYILTDCMNTFCRFFREGFDLDPMHFTTLPAAAWSAMLKRTKVNMELFGPDEQDMYLFVESSIRGGLSMVGTKRYARANNPQVPGYKPHEDTAWLMYADANALYAYCMSQPLPCGGYEWEDPETFDLTRADTGREGYLVEVDAYCPPCSDPTNHEAGCTCLHDHQQDLPCLPESMSIHADELSPEQRRWMARPCPMGDKKLMATLTDKKHYAVHLDTLQMAVAQGWVISKIHRVLKYNKKPWLKPYIDFNIGKRKEAIQAGSAFGKDFYKLMNNIVFGKTMEDVRKYGKTLLVSKTSEEARYRKTTQDPGFKCEIDLNDDLVAMMVEPKTVLLNKPILVGSAILDMSKVHMQSFWYNQLKRRYGKDVSLVYMDTDSFIFPSQVRGSLRGCARTPQAAL